MNDDFSEFSIDFVAGSSTTIRFENDSPGGDKSIFVDAITIGPNVPRITNVVTSASSQCEYYAEVVAVGDEYYCDRTYTFVTVPDFLDGADHIVTANNDKNSDPLDLDWLCFDLTEDSTVYVLYDSRVTDGQEPAWLTAGFTDQHEEVRTQFIGEPWVVHVGCPRCSSSRRVSLTRWTLTGDPSHGRQYGLL